MAGWLLLLSLTVVVSSLSCVRLFCDTVDGSPPGSCVHGTLQARVGCPFLLREIFPTQGLNLHLLHLLHCRQILYLVTMTLDLTVTLNFPEISPSSWFPLPPRQGFPGSSVGKESTCNAGALGDTGLILGLGRSPRGGNGNSLQYSFLENPMNRGAWRATVHGVTKSWTRLKWLNTDIINGL